MRRKEWIAIFILVLTCVSAGCRAEGQAVDSSPIPVKVKAVETHSSKSGTRYSANITPRTQVELAFKVSGYIDGLHQVRGVDGRMRDLQDGDIVLKGTVLARVRQSDYQVKVKQAESQASEALSALDSSRSQLAEAHSSVEASKSQQAEATAAYERAKLDFDRAKNLFAAQSMTKSNFDAARAQFDMAEAKLAAAGSQVAMTEARETTARSQVEAAQARIKASKAVVEEATIPLQDTELKAPMDCIVLNKSVEVGTLVSAGKTGFTIADTSSVKAIFGVPDLMLENIKLGSPLDVTTEAMSNRKFRGQITAISPAADPKSRVFEVEVTIPNPDQSLKSGMIASLELVEGKPTQNVMVVPVSAIVRSKQNPDQYAVFVVDDKAGKQITRQRTVKLGEALGNTIVLLDGVSLNERVIISGATLVTDGQAILIVP
jgi:RND family efflux transporter MFP subunit